MWNRLFLVMLVAMFQSVSTSYAEPGDEVLLSGPAYLRALSLDVRGHPPTFEEYGQLLDASDSFDAEAVMDAWMNDDGVEEDKFADRIVRFHKNRFWNNNVGTGIGYYLWQLKQDSSTGIWFAPRKSWLYGRGVETSCSNTPATFDAEANPVLINSQWGLRDEGYVMVDPYWDPGNPVKVCALDAQDQYYASNGTECFSDDGWSNARCGCGPNLSFCFYDYYDTGVRYITSSFDEDVNRRVAEMIRKDRPYTELLTDNRAWVNGPIVNHLKYKKDIWMFGANFTNAPYDVERLPDLEWTEINEWREVELGPEQAGIFTSPAFLLRFMSNRARANRFFNEFLCQPFQTPEGGLPVGSDSIPTLNLNQRDGCKYCHSLLEPSAATWGRWVEGGVGYLDPERYPDQNSACEEDVFTRDCRYYVNATTLEEYPFVGYLDAFLFLEERHHENITLGPKLLVEQGIQDGRLQQCVARKAAEYWLDRELEDDEEEWLHDLATRFENSNWDYKFLVKEILKSSSYRRLP